MTCARIITYLGGPGFLYYFYAMFHTPTINNSWENYVKIHTRPELLTRTDLQSPTSLWG